MKEILDRFDPITLEQMSGIRLMNRTDTKFVTTLPMLMKLLNMARGDYFAQEIGGERIAAYYTQYFDTADQAMYVAHETGHTNRQKLRIRSYVDSQMSFLEVKTKNNHGRTRKKRIAMTDFDPMQPRHDIAFGPADATVADFLHSNLRYDPALLSGQIENRFDRITLVNKAMTERLTIDTRLRFSNIITGKKVFMDNIAIIELKRDGRVPSPILGLLNQLRIHPMGFSKYCIGSALTNSRLRRNRIKPRLRRIGGMLNVVVVDY